MNKISKVMLVDNITRRYSKHDRHIQIGGIRKSEQGEAKGNQFFNLAVDDVEGDIFLDVHPGRQFVRVTVEVIEAIVDTI